MVLGRSNVGNRKKEVPTLAQPYGEQHGVSRVGGARVVAALGLSDNAVARQSCYFSSCLVLQGASADCT